MGIGLALCKRIYPSLDSAVTGSGMGVWFPIVSLSPTSGTLIPFSINGESFGTIHCTIIESPALVLPLLTHVMWWEEWTLEAGVGEGAFGKRIFTLWTSFLFFVE